MRIDILRVIETEGDTFSETEILIIRERVKYQFPQAPFQTYNLLEELTLYKIVERSRMLLEDGDFAPETGWDEWVYDLTHDDELEMIFHPDNCIPPGSSFHFDNWI